jgi:hypothetical protein
MASRSGPSPLEGSARTSRRGLALVTLVAIGSLLVVWAATGRASAAAYHASGPDRLITNHYAYWSPDDPAAFRDPFWEMESGSLFRHAGSLWTGLPTDNLPNRDSSNGSGSQVFRLWTKRSDFGDVRVEMDLRNNAFTAGSHRRPAMPWDGVKIWLRRQGASGEGGSIGLYVAEVNRRLGNVIIQKKCEGSDHYHSLPNASGRRAPARIGRWERVGATVRTNPGGSVTIQVLRDHRVVLTGTDRGRGCDPITAAGRVGVRGDNTNFHFDNFEVTPLG